MRIGVDFDNTIADYGAVFMLTARQEGLVPADFVGDKAAVREALRALAQGEELWMRLQGKVYGALMGYARPIEGFAAFLARSKAAGVDVFIVSHKTEYGHFDEARVNLRDAARRWMEAQGFFAANGLGPERVFFEATRADKIARIAALACDHFVDDLKEVFLDPDFPPGTGRHLLSRGAKPLPQGPFTAYRSWDAISDVLLS